MTDAAPDKPAPSLTAREEWSELARTAIVAIVLALIVRTFAIEPFNIPSGSMLPSLQIGDYLFVSKPAYGYSRWSFPFGLAPLDGRIMEWHEPQRGDIVVFKKPTDTSVDYIKRLIGLPGDTIQVTDGRLYINHKLIPRRFLGMERVSEEGRDFVMTKYEETLPNGVRHFIYEIDDSQPLDNTPEYTVPPDHYFMMGDNRDNSQDSRVQTEVGFVPAENFVGRAELIFFSTNGTAALPEFWKWPWSVRYDRLLTLIRPTGYDTASHDSKPANGAAP